MFSFFCPIKCSFTKKRDYRPNFYLTMKDTVTQILTRKSALMTSSDPFVLKTTLNMQPTHIHELKSAARRTFGLLILEFIWKHLLRARFGCRNFSPEEHGCDAWLTNCTKAPLRPKACIESKYVENFWLKKGTLLQKVKDASSKLRRAESRGFKNRFLLVSSFAIKRYDRETVVPQVKSSPKRSYIRYK